MEQSFRNDVHMVLSSNLVPILVPVGVMIFLLMVATTASSSIQKKKPKKGSPSNAPPSWMVVGFVVVVFEVLHAMDFDVGIAPLSYDICRSDLEDIASPTNNPYTNFTDFYSEAYVDAHREYASRASHFILASSVITLWLWDTQLMVTSIIALLVGAVSTLPLACCESEYLEMAIVLVTGIMVSKLAFDSLGRKA